MANLAKEDLIAQGCTEPRKVLLAGLLWKKTTVSQAWIAEHLGMKNAANVSRVIHRMDLSQLQEKVSGNLRRFRENFRFCIDPLLQTSKFSTKELCGQL